MQTEIGRELARHNADFLIQFMAKLSAELQGDCLGWIARCRAASVAVCSLNCGNLFPVFIVRLKECRKIDQ
jgi:hypothetical protein